VCVRACVRGGTLTSSYITPVVSRAALSSQQEKPTERLQSTEGGQEGARGSAATTTTV
jgi:hypothetical protein